MKNYCMSPEIKVKSESSIAKRQLSLKRTLPSLLEKSKVVPCIKNNTQNIIRHMFPRFVRSKNISLGHIEHSPSISLNMKHSYIFTQSFQERNKRAIESISLSAPKAKYKKITNTKSVKNNLKLKPQFTPIKLQSVSSVKSLEKKVNLTKRHASISGVPSEDYVKVLEDHKERVSSIYNYIMSTTKNSTQEIVKHYFSKVKINLKAAKSEHKMKVNTNKHLKVDTTPKKRKCRILSYGRWYLKPSAFSRRLNASRKE